MNIMLYLNSSPDNKIDKTITLKNEITGALRDNCSIITPSILCNLESPVGFNYAYIPTFERYYFVKNITVFNNNLYLLDLEVDVLMSNKTEILDQTGIIERQEFLFNLDLYDPELPVKKENFILTKAMKNTVPFSNAGFIVTVEEG